MPTTSDFPTAYLRLRTLLDALEVNALRYCLDGADNSARIARMEGLDGELTNLIKHVGGEAPCDAGYFNCGGVCVPYACFLQFMEQPEASQAEASKEKAAD